MSRPFAAPWISLPLCAAAVSLVQAQSLNVANHSFESPEVLPPFPVDTRIDSWTKTPQPDWFEPQGGITWDQLSGVFPNTAPGTPNHIANLDGNQAVYLFALPQAGLSQVLDSRYEAGLQYTMTIGLRGGGNIAEGSTLLLGFFYVDDAGAPVTVATAQVSYSAAAFGDPSQLQDRQVATGVVGAGDATIGKNIGIQIVGVSGQGEGYWDMDNVRVTAEVVPEPQTWALLALGACGLLFAGRRNRR